MTNFRILVLITVTFLSVTVRGQMPEGVLHIPPTGAVAGQPVTIEAIVDGQVVDSRIYHRISGSSGYQEEEMSFTVSTWKGTIPGNFVSDRGLEYAIVFTMRDGSSLGYPRGDAVSSPQFVNVIPAPTRTMRMDPYGVLERRLQVMVARSTIRAVRASDLTVSMWTTSSVLIGPHLNCLAMGLGLVW